LHNFVESLLPTVTVDNILEGEKPDAIGECRPILPAPRLQNRVLSDYEPSGSELQGRLLGNLDPEIVEENSLGEFPLQNGHHVPAESFATVREIATGEPFFVNSRFAQA